MAESAIRAVIGPAKDALAERNRNVDRACMWAIRECGRKVKQRAKKRARVYGGSDGVRISAVKKARKAGVNLLGDKLGKGETVEGNQVVKGLLRDSISSSRRIDNFGGTMSIKVAPRGPRVYLYAKKIEALDHYMSMALAETLPEMSDIHAQALRRVMDH